MVWPLAGTNPSNSQKNVQKTYAANHPAEGRMQQDGAKQRRVIQKKVLFPIDGPGQIEQQRSHLEGEYNPKCARNPAYRCMEIHPAWMHVGSADGPLKSSEAFREVEVVDVHRVDLGKILQRRFRLARRLLGHTQIIPQGKHTFRIDSGSVQSALVPNRGDGRLALFHKGEAQQRAALHGVAEGAAIVAGLGDFLELADGFFEQAHLAEGDSEIVVRLKVFFLGAHFAEFGAKLFENLFERAGFRGRRW